MIHRGHPGLGWLHPYCAVGIGLLSVIMAHLSGTLPDYLILRDKAELLSALRKKYAMIVPD